MKHKHPAAASAARPAAPAKSTRQPVADSASAGVLDEGERETQVREAAYFRYLAHGAEVGNEMEDWLQAEAELLEAGKADKTNH